MFYYCLNCGEKTQECSFCENIPQFSKLRCHLTVKGTKKELLIHFPDNKILKNVNFVGTNPNIIKITTKLYGDKFDNYQFIDINNTFNNLSDNVVSINCSLNYIRQLDNLPEHLVELNCSLNGIQQLDNLPNQLKKLNCSDCKISQLDNLPSQLRELNCSKNKIVNLDQLPNNLIYLDCSYNLINQLDSLPNSIEYLFTTGNKIYTYMTLPSELKQLNLVKYENKETKQHIDKFTLSYKNYLYGLCK